jgi:hypothetical protein
MRPLYLLGLVLSFATPAAVADTLHMKGGGTLEGDAVLEGDHYRVRLPSGGEAIIPAADVERVEAGDTFRDEYIRRLNQLDRTDAEGHYRLGLFCQDHGLKREAEYLFRHAVRVVPQHEGARAALGEVLFDGEWMPQEEAYRRQGLVRHGARWVTAEEKASLEFEDRAREWGATVQRLGRRVRGTDAAQREDAARQLAVIEDPAAIGALLEAAGHWHPAVRATAARALGRFAERDDGCGLKLFRLACQDEDVRVQDEAIAVIGERKLGTVAELLLNEYIESDEAAVRKAAANALGKIRYKPAFEPLVATLYFAVLRNRLVPSDIGATVFSGPGHGPNPPQTFNSRRHILRSYRLQPYTYRVVEDTAFNDAARQALKSLCDIDFDFDRPRWRKWWAESEPGFDLWMRPVKPAGEAAKPPSEGPAF